KNKEKVQQWQQIQRKKILDVNNITENNWEEVKNFTGLETREVEKEIDETTEIQELMEKLENIIIRAKEFNLPTKEIITNNRQKIKPREIFKIRRKNIMKREQLEKLDKLIEKYNKKTLLWCTAEVKRLLFLQQATCYKTTSNLLENNKLLVVLQVACCFDRHEKQQLVTMASRP
ncbi:hypothetical protein C1645_841754, partial [Glomus cerebriforme]